MIRHLLSGVKRSFGLHRPGRSFLILPDDVFLVSFPKSGNTWARFLLANLTRPEQPATFANIHLLIPDPSWTTKKELDRLPRPRIIKSHECFDPRYRRVIYIVRDPRDVAVSQYTVDDIVNYWLQEDGLPPNTGVTMCTDGLLTPGVTGYDALGADGVEVQYVLQEDVGHGCSKTWPATINESFQTHPKVQPN